MNLHLIAVNVDGIRSLTRWRQPDPTVLTIAPLKHGFVAIDDHSHRVAVLPVGLPSDDEQVSDVNVVFKHRVVANLKHEVIRRVNLAGKIEMLGLFSCQDGSSGSDRPNPRQTPQPCNELNRTGLVGLPLDVSACLKSIEDNMDDLWIFITKMNENIKNGRPVTVGLNFINICCCRPDIGWFSDMGTFPSCEIRRGGLANKRFGVLISGQ